MSELRARAAYWRTEVERAAGAVDAWYREHAPLAWGDSAGLAARNAEGLMRRALRLLETPETAGTVARLDSLVRPLVEGMYLQVNTPPPRWTEPFVDTWRETKTAVVDTVKTASTWGAGGAALGLVLVGAAYLVATGRVRV